MSRQMRKYNKEFKLEAIQLVEIQGGNASAVARDLGISPNLLNRWIREYNSNKKNAFPGLGKRKESEEEVYKLKKELADLKMERDILKKALSIFSKPSH